MVPTQASIDHQLVDVNIVTSHTQQQQQERRTRHRRGRRGGRGRGGRNNSSSNHSNVAKLSDFLLLDGDYSTRNNTQCTHAQKYDDNETCTTESLSSSSSSDDDDDSSSVSSQLSFNNRSQHALEAEVKQKRQQPLQRYVALDCELVGVGPSGKKSIVSRVTLVGWNGDVIWDQYIKPTETVTNYRTHVSGITRDILQRATVSFEECQQHLLLALKDKILVGHALKNDLRALQISHPWQQTRDTGKYEPFMKTRQSEQQQQHQPEGFNSTDCTGHSRNAVLWPRKLRDLVGEKLGREIQADGQPHSSYEDAVAAMDLYKLVRKKWEKVMDYKIRKTKQIEEQQQKQQLQTNQQ